MLEPHLKMNLEPDLYYCTTAIKLMPFLGFGTFCIIPFYDALVQLLHNWSVIS